MANNCNMYPQLLVDGKFEDSALFKQLWKEGTTLFPDNATTARSYAKAMYNHVNSPMTRAVIGDFKLLRHATHNNLTPAESVRFVDLYNADINRLKESIAVDLNRQGEPNTMDGKQSVNLSPSYYINPNSNLKLETTQKYQNAILAGFALNMQAELLNLDFRDVLQNRTIRGALISRLEDHVKTLKAIHSTIGATSVAGFDVNQIAEMIANNEKWVNDLRNNTREAWTEFKSWYEAEYKTEIREESFRDMVDEEDIDSNMHVSQENKVYDKSGQMKVNRANTASVKLKSYIASLLYKDLKNDEGTVFNMMNKNITLDRTAESDGKPTISINGTQGQYYSYGLAMPLSFKDVWTDMLAVNQLFGTSKDSVIDGLRLYNSTKWGNQLDEFIAELENEDNVRYNQYMASTNMAMSSSNMSIVNRLDDSLQYHDKQLNRDSFLVKKCYAVYKDAVYKAFQFKANHRVITSNESPISTSRPGFMSSHVDAVLNTLNEVGVNMSKSAILNYMTARINERDFVKNGHVTYEMVNVMYVTSNLPSEVRAAKLREINPNIDIKQLEIGILNLVSEIDRVVFGISNTRQLGLKGYLNEAVENKDKYINLNELKDKYTDVTDNLNGVLNKLAYIGAYDPNHSTQLMFTNASYETEYTPQHHNYLTQLLQGLSPIKGVANIKTVLDKISHFTQDPSNNHNELLWNIYGSNGILNPKRDKQGNPIIDNKGCYTLSDVNPVNEDAFKEFEYSQYNGMRDEQTGTGMDYTDMQGQAWNMCVAIHLMQGTCFLQSSDASRIYSFKMHTNHLSREQAGHVLNGSRDWITRDINGNYTGIFRSLLNTIESEITDARKAIQEYFVRDNKTGEWKVNPYYITNLTELKRAPSPKYWDGVSLFHKKDNKKKGFVKGEPTGTAFKIQNMTYLKDGKQFGILDHIKTLFPDSSLLDIINDLTSAESDIGLAVQEGVLLKSSLPTIMERFITDWAMANMQVNKEHFNILRLSFEENATYRNYVHSNYLGYKSKPPTSKDESYGRLKEVMSTEAAYDYVILDTFLNDYIMGINATGLFTGKMNEFTGSLDANKRANGNIRPGAVTPSNKTYDQVIINDVIKPSNMMAPLLAMYEEGSSEYYSIKAAYDKAFATTDGINYITQEEALQRFKEKGIYEEYNYTLADGTVSNYIDDMMKPAEEGKSAIPPARYKQVLEQLKYFYFGRDVYQHGKPGVDGQPSITDIVTHQDKNSTIVLFDRFIKGTEFETMANWMRQNGISSVNTKSGHKTGGMQAVDVATVNEDGSVTSNFEVGKDGIITLKGTPDLTPYVHTLSYNNLRTQQTIPSHLEDETNNLGVQLIKKSVDGINANYIYKIPNGLDPDGNQQYLALPGKSGSHSNPGLFESYQAALSEEAIANFHKLMGQWGALDENGRLKVNPDGTYQVNHKKILSDLYKYYDKSSSDLNFMKAVKVNSNGVSNIPLFHPMIAKSIENVLLNKLTKNITKLKFKGGHVIIQPDTFWKPNQAVFEGDALIKGTDKLVHRMLDEGQVSFAPEFLAERMNEDGTYKEDANWSLKGEYWGVTKDANGKLLPEDQWSDYHPAEIILNRWDSRLKAFEDKATGKLDLSRIPEDVRTMLGIRIPTEGHQSITMCKVVGVMNTGTSQAVIPEHFTKRSGSDFDIDSLYLYMREFDMLNGVPTVNRYNREDKQSVNNRLLEHANTYFKGALDSIANKHFQRTKPYNAIINKANAVIDKTVATSALFNGLGLPTKLKEVVLFNRKMNRDIVQYEQLLKEAKQQNNEEEINKINSILNDYSVKIRNSYTFAFENNLLEKLENIDAYAKEIDDYNNAIDAIKKSRTELLNISKDLSNERVEYIKTNVKPHYDNAGDKYDGLNRTKNVFRKASEAERHNAILDMIFGVFMSPDNTLNREHANEFDDVTKASDYINSMLGINPDTFNINNLQDKIALRNLNMSIATLKAISVSWDSVVAILGAINGELSGKYTIPMRMDWSEIPGYKEGGEAAARANLVKTFGEKGFKEVDGQVIVTIKHVYNNESESWTNLAQERISNQRGQLTANVFDAVKAFLSNNTNNLTFGTLAMLSATPCTWYHEGTDSVNCFIYPMLLNEQPCIVDFVNEVQVKGIYNNQSNTRYSWNTIRSNYMYSYLHMLSVQHGETFNSIVVGLKEKGSISDETYNYLESIVGLDVDDRMLTSAPNIGSKLAKELSTVLQSIHDVTGVRVYNSSNTVAQKAKTLTQLDTYFQQNKDNNLSDQDYTEFLANQLDVLDYYLHIDGSVSAVSKTQSILKTEKLGAGSTTSVSNKLFNAMANVEFDIQTLKRNLIEADVPSDVISQFIKEYFQIEDIPGKARLIAELKEKVKEYKVEFPESAIMVKGKTIVRSVFPSAFNEGVIVANGSRIGGYDWNVKLQKLEPSETGEYLIVNSKGEPMTLDQYKHYDYRHSSYPYLDAQYQATNVTASKVFHDIILSEKPVYKAAINTILSELNKSNDYTVRTKLVDYIVTSRINEMPFFNHSVTMIEGLAEDTRTPQEMIGDLLGVLYFKDGVSEVTNKEEHTLVAPDFSLATLKANQLGNNFLQRLEVFRRLPLAVQLEIAKKSLDIKDEAHILNVLSGNLNEKSVAKVGIAYVKTNESPDIASTRTSLYQMYNSTDLFQMIVAENIMKYAYYVSGFNFGNNSSNLIPMELLYSEEDTFSDLSEINTNDYTWVQMDGTTTERMTRGDDSSAPYLSGSRLKKYPLHEYASYLRSAMDMVNSDTKGLLENFVKANSENKDIVKPLKPTFTTDYKKRKKVTDSHLPTFKAINPTVFKNAEQLFEELDLRPDTSNTLDKVISHILVDSTESIKNSQYADTKYGTKLTPGFLGLSTAAIDNKDVLYKRFDSVVDGNTYWFPINKTMKTESETSSIPMNTRNVESEGTYLTIIDELAKLNIPKIVNTPNITMEGKQATRLTTYKESIDVATAKSDAVLYIGDSNDLDFKLVDSSNKEAVSLDDLKSRSKTLGLRNNETVLVFGKKEASPLENQGEVNGKIVEGLYTMQKHNLIGDIVTLNTDGASQGVVTYLHVQNDVQGDVISYGKKAIRLSPVGTTYTRDTDTGNMVNVGINTTLIKIQSKLKQHMDNALRLTKSVENSNVILDIKSNLAIAATKNAVALDGEEYSFQNSLEAIKFNRDVFKSLYSTTDTLWKALDEVDINVLLNHQNKDFKYSSRIDFVKQLNIIREYVAMLDNMTELPFVDVNSLEVDSFNSTTRGYMNEYNDILSGINDSAKGLKSIKEAINSKILYYLQALAANESRNPEIEGDTLFTYMQKELAAKGWSNEEIADFKADEGAQARIHSLLKDNVDITYIMLNANSGAETGIPLIDILFAQYAGIQLENSELMLDKIQEFQSIFRDSTNSVLSQRGRLKPKFDANRQRQFKDAFIDRTTGQIVTKYNYVAFKDDMSAEVEDIKSKLSTQRDESLVRFKEIENELNTLRTELSTYAKQETKEGKTSRDKLLIEIQILNAELSQVKDVINNYQRNVSQAYYDNMAANSHMEELSKDSAYDVYLMDIINKQPNKARFLAIHHLREVEENVYRRVVPGKLGSDKYVNKQYESLSNNEGNLKMLNDLKLFYAQSLQDMYGSLTKDDSYFPITFKEGLKSKLKEIFGLRDIVEDDYFITLTGNKQFYLKSNVLNNIKSYNVFKPTRKPSDMSMDDYNNSIIEQANVWGKKHNKTFTSRAEINAFNREQAKLTMEKVLELVNYDPINATMGFLEELKQVKIVRDIEQEYNLINSVLESSDFESRNGVNKNDKIKNTINKWMSSVLNKPINVTEKGKDTRAYKSLDRMKKVLYRTSRVENRSDQIAAVLHRLNSQATMGFNFTAVVKNIGKGLADDVTESLAGEFVTKKSMISAMGRYSRMVPLLLRNRGEYQVYDGNNPVNLEGDKAYESSALSVALIKLAGGIFEDQTERTVQPNQGGITKGVSAWDSAAYMPTASAEHMLQFVTFLSALESNRIVQGHIMNFDQYTYYARENAFKDVLGEMSPEGLVAYEALVVKLKERRGSNSIYTDTVKEFFRDKSTKAIADKLGGEFTTKFVKARKANLATARKTFDALPDVRSQFIVKNGVATISDDSLLDLQRFGRFTGMVQEVNHSLHGVYNRFDSSMITDSIYGELFMQFRKWVKPSWDRYFGKRMGYDTFNERLGSFRGGAYADTFRLVRDSFSSVVTDGMSDGWSAGNVITGVSNLLLGFHKVFSNAILNYNLMPTHQQRNVMRTAGMFMHLLMYSGASWLAMAILKGDDDDDKGLLAQNAEAMLLIYLTGVQTELYETLDWYAFFDRTTKDPIAAQRIFKNLANVVYYGFGSLWMDEEDYIYQSGAYADRDKASVNLFKALPFVSQVQKHLYIKNSQNYYVKGNWILRSLNSTDDSDDRDDD